MQLYRNFSGESTIFMNLDKNFEEIFSNSILYTSAKAIGLQEKQRKRRAVPLLFSMICRCRAQPFSSGASLPSEVVSGS